MSKNIKKNVTRNYLIKGKTIFGICMVLLCAFCIVSACSTPVLAANDDITDIYSGNTKFVDTSITILKIFRFLAFFAVIGGIIWAAAEFGIKHDQQRGAAILICALVGGVAVLIAPTLMGWVVGALGLGGLDNIQN
jgi:fucose permease